MDRWWASILSLGNDDGIPVLVGQNEVCQKWQNLENTIQYNTIGNEWTHDKKLSEVDVRSKKMTQNIPKRSFLVLSTNRWTWGDLFFFVHGAHESVGKNIFFCSEPVAEKILFRINFDGSVGKPETRLFLGLSCGLKSVR